MSGRMYRLRKDGEREETSPISQDLEAVKVIDMREDAAALYEKVVDYVLNSREPVETIASKLSMVGFLQRGFMLVEAVSYTHLTLPTKA